LTWTLLTWLTLSDAEFGPQNFAACFCDLQTAGYRCFADNRRFKRKESIVGNIETNKGLREKSNRYFCCRHGECRSAEVWRTPAQLLTIAKRWDIHFRLRYQSTGISQGKNRSAVVSSHQRLHYVGRKWMNRRWEALRIAIE
jgi:hypothetical protein